MDHGKRKHQHNNKKSLLSDEEKRRLGLDRSITRRDFLKVMAAGAGGLMLHGCSGLTSGLNVPPTSASSQYGDSYFGGNTEESRFICHQVRDGKKFSRGAKTTGEIYDLVVVGAGLGGLAAAYFYNQERPEEEILLLDNHVCFGGDAQRNELTVKGQNIIATQAGDYNWPRNMEL